MKHKVKSSMMKSIEYNDGVLRVEFNNGNRYDYKDVSQKMFDDLLNADSVGKHFCKEIKSKCKCEKC